MRDYRILISIFRIFGVKNLTFMINIPVKISVPEIWKGQFEKENWNFVNFIVGANGTGKSLFSEQLKQEMQRNKLQVRLLTAERLAGFEKFNYTYFSNSGFNSGLDISNFNTYKSYGEQYGLSTSAFVILKERLDIRIKIEALLSDLFKKSIRLVEEGGYLKPKMQNIDGGAEYVLKEKECHVLIQEMDALFLCPFTLMGKTEQTEEKTFFVRTTVKAFIAFRNQCLFVRCIPITGFTAQFRLELRIQLFVRYSESTDTFFQFDREKAATPRRIGKDIRMVTVL